jgi:hypothetical protein
VSAVVAIVAAPLADTLEATEFLRMLAALRALDVAVVVHEIAAGVGTFSGVRDASPDGERYLAALVEDGVSVRGLEGLADAVATASAVTVLADPARSGVPEVFAWARGERPSAIQLATMAASGQVRLV